jgi:DNA-nicking Smr family endonuclease
MKKPPPDDLHAWLEEIEGVKPLDTAKRTRPTTQVDDLYGDDLPPPKAATPQPPPLQPKAAPFADAKPNPTFATERQDTNCLSGALSSLDGRTRKRLAQGELAPSRKIDLHGYYVDDAWQALMGFLHDCYQQGHRCVLVVHGKGKGYGPDGEMGAIKAQVSGWLGACPVVMAFHTAIPRHGGSGAVYVLLRRQRENNE